MSGSGPEHVQEEDLAQLVRGGLTEDKTIVIWSHVSECEACSCRLDGAAEAARQSAAIGRQQRAQHPEKQREFRFPANETASMRMVNPLFLDRTAVRVLNVSKNGLMLHASEFVQVGIVVQIRLKNRFVLGEVRYCIPVGETFHVGVQIQDSQRRRVLDGSPPHA